MAEAMQWAADRAVRMRGSARKRGAGVSLFVMADELVMLLDRVSAGAEISEEDGWSELLEKLRVASRRLAEVPRG